MCSAGLPREAIQDVYKAAITKAGSSNTQQQLSNGFVSALTQIDDVNSGQELLDNLLAAVEATIKASGCVSAQKFTQGGVWGLDGMQRLCWLGGALHSERSWVSVCVRASAMHVHLA